jgi:hypothetical protein
MLSFNILGENNVIYSREENLVLRKYFEGVENSESVRPVVTLMKYYKVC